MDRTGRQCGMWKWDFNDFKVQILIYTIKYLGGNGETSYNNRSRQYSMEEEILLSASLERWYWQDVQIQCQIYLLYLCFMVLQFFACAVPDLHSTYLTHLCHPGRQFSSKNEQTWFFQWGTLMCDIGPRTLRNRGLILWRRSKRPLCLKFCSS